MDASLTTSLTVFITWTKHHPNATLLICLIIVFLFLHRAMKKGYEELP